MRTGVSISVIDFVQAIVLVPSFFMEQATLTGRAVGWLSERSCGLQSKKTVRDVPGSLPCARANGPLRRVGVPLIAAMPDALAPMFVKCQRDLDRVGPIAILALGELPYLQQGGREHVTPTFGQGAFGRGHESFQRVKRCRPHGTPPNRS
jgi:hypothetical protein